MDDNYLQYICCPKCKSDLKKLNNFLVCKNCHQRYEVEGGIMKIMPNLTEDIKLSIEKWDKIYEKQLREKSYYDDYKQYKQRYLKDTYTQLNSAKKIKDIVYLEIGCGQFFLGQKIARDVKLIIGIDFCPSALEIAKKMLDEKNIRNYLLIQADILNLPLKNNVVDLIYGGGVIEHFRDTQKCLSELYRVLDIDGVSFNTVPYLNLGAFTYRQIWGNIPDLPILKQLAEFIHIRLLKSKHMIFGYEMSFPKYKLKKIHQEAGFKDVKIDKFQVKLVFDFFPAFIRRPFIWLADYSRLFWPVVKVIGKK